MANSIDMRHPISPLKRLSLYGVRTLIFVILPNRGKSEKEILLFQVEKSTDKMYERRDIYKFSFFENLMYASTSYHFVLPLDRCKQFDNRDKNPLRQTHRHQTCQPYRLKSDSCV